MVAWKIEALARTSASFAAAIAVFYTHPAIAPGWIHKFVFTLIGDPSVAFILSAVFMGGVCFRIFRDQIPLNGTVMVTEQLGDEQLLAVRLGDGEIRIAGVDPDLSLSTGSQIEAAVATDHLHFFDELEQMQ